jgi:SAM-dependent methyltransferase
MNTGTPTYRWNTSAAAEAFDQSAEFIHPRYLTVQEQVIGQLPFADDEPFLIVDLGAGSGRLIERILAKFPNSRAALVDQSEPFLAIAERRLHRFRERSVLIQRRLQDNWSAELPATPRAFVSMSAIHHLDAAEKQALFARCHDALTNGGVFINGDEYRPESDADYLATLQWWAEQKELAEKRGQIPQSFRPVFDAWYDRNIRRFGEPKVSGDDCHETIATQVSHLQATGFREVRIVWSERLWSVLVARTVAA